MSKRARGDCLAGTGHMVLLPARCVDRLRPSAKDNLAFFGSACFNTEESKMRKTPLSLVVAVMTMLCANAKAQPREALEVYFIDVEGGQSTLLVSPSGQ